MRVGIDATVLHGRYTGVARAVAGLILALAERDDDNDYYLYCGQEIPRLGDLPPSFRWRPMAFPASSRWRTARWQQNDLDPFAQRDRVELLHCPAYVGPTRGRVPLVLSIYDLHVFTHPQYCSWLNRWHYRRVIPSAARRAKAIIVPSDAVAQTVVRRLSVPDRKVHTVRLATESRFRHIQAADILDDVRTALDLPERFFLFVGNIEPRKGVPRMVEAFTRARQRNKLEHKLLLAGKPGVRYREVRKRVQALKAETHVRELGFVGDDVMPHLYNLATAVICPAPWEGFGLPALEAMACGTPVIASNSGALPEVCGDAALMVKADSVAELTEAIGKVAQDAELRYDLRRFGLTRAEQFSWRAHADQALAIYEEAVNG